VFAGSCLKIIVNNLFVGLYFLWLCSSYSIFCLFLLIFKLFLTSVLKLVYFTSKKTLFDRTFSYIYEFHWN
jgi:hypothetical protein